MSQPRGLANHSLYLANVLVGAWDRTLAERDVPRGVADQAFFPAVRLHLVCAYGWFLLEVVDADTPADGRPPACCAELPRRAPGIATSGELRELEHLEQEGWLRAMLATHELSESAVRSQGNLAASRTGPDIEDARDWSSRLAELMMRMRDSLEEC